MGVDAGRKRGEIAWLKMAKLEWGKRSEEYTRSHEQPKSRERMMLS